MPLDREETLKRAEKLLRQGRLDAAIAEYCRVVEEQPLDWTAANTLGDLYVRAARSEQAVAEYARIAEHFHREGFFSKAAALYKKILKISPDDERAQVNLADVSAAQGLAADARAHLSAVAARRRARGDAAGADDIVVRLGEIDPGDFGARRAAARVLERRGRQEQAAAHYRALHDALADAGQEAAALDMLREVARLTSGDAEARAASSAVAMQAGDPRAAREHSTEPGTADDTSMLVRLLELQVREGRIEEARGAAARVQALDGSLARVVEAAWALAGERPDAALSCVEFAVDEAVRVSDFAAAAGFLREFVARVPGSIPALLRLVEVSVDGGLETAMYDAQALLADAYLDTERAAEARVIAEDLLAHEPWEAAHADRLRRALALCGVADPDAAVAERLHPAAGLEEPGAAPRAVELAPVDAAGVAPAASDLPPAEELGPVPAEEVDLTEALAELQASAATPRAVAPPASLEAVFQEMRDEASRAGGAVEAAQQMALGRTYLEIGMVDDALEAFRHAARWPGQRFEAAATIARLHRQRGENARAIEWMERAAQVPAPTNDAAHTLLYELGVTLEACGETARALAVFLELQADDPAYRDTAVRVQRLARAEAGG